MIAPWPREPAVALPPTAELQIDGRATGGTPKSLVDAHEGQAQLLVITGARTTERQLAALEVFVRMAGPDDRIALGLIDGDGFRLLRGFSVDARPLLAAARGLGTLEPGAPTGPVALFQGLFDALATFRGESSLPAARQLIVITDAIDTSIRRRSVLERLAVSVRNRASAFEVTPSSVLFGTVGAAHAAFQSVILGAGGHVETAVDESAESYAAAAMSLTGALRSLVVIDVEVAEVPAGDHHVKVDLGRAAGALERHVLFPEPSQGRVAIVMPVPEPAAPLLPPGVVSVSAATADAAAAEEAGDVLRAGALWYRVAEAAPDSRPAREKAAALDTRWRAEGSPTGRLVDGDAFVDVAVPVRVEPALANTLATINRSRPLLGDTWVRPRRTAEAPLGPPAPTAPAIPITQVILYPCEGSTVDACTLSLIDSGMLAHVVVDPAGGITQLVDLASAVPELSVRPVESIVIAIATPALEAATWLDPSSPDTRRWPRDRARAVPVSGGVADAWDITAGQMRALVPLLSALYRHFDSLKPFFPVLDSGKPTLETLASPNAYVGFLTACNVLRARRLCVPTLATLAALNERVRRFRFGAESTAMESWGDLLVDPYAHEGTVLRFSRVGPPAVDLLLELATDAPRESLGRIVPAIVAAAAGSTDPELRRRVAVALAKLAESFDGPTSQGLAAAPPPALMAIARGVVELGDSVAAARVLAVALPFGASQELGFWLLPLRVTAASTPLSSADLVSWLGQADVGTRATIVAALSLADPAGAAERLAGLRDDPEPWIRYLVAVATGGADAIAALVTLASEHHVTFTRIITDLRRLSPGAPVPAVVDWVETAADGDLPAVESAVIGWKWRDAVPVLARKLATLAEPRRSRVVALLKALVGHDFGAAPDGYLEWYRKDKGAPAP